MKVAKFAREVKIEGIKKVTWPAYKEALNASLMVLASVLFFMLFFLIIDSLLFFAIQSVLDL